ncbi:MAG: hypothetical protein IKH59_01570 [Bacteroidaceae bacterium]|nr:hypothetical protein [Bacteroidaceae bacterium]
MEHLGGIANTLDVVTKKYVDDRVVSSSSTFTGSTLTLAMPIGNVVLDVPTFNQNTTGNAATATKLASAVSLWGNSFDGSSDISGTLTVQARLGLQIYEQESAAASRYRLTLGHLSTSGYTTVACIYNYNGSAYGDILIGTTSSGLFYDASSGYWGIGSGSNTPGYKLHVDGTLGVTGAATLGGGLSVNGNTALTGALNVTGVTGYAQGIRIHKTENVSSLWFGAVNETGFDAGMFGLTLDGTGLRFRGTATAEGTTPSDYLKILYGGNVGIGTSSPSYKLHVVGSAMLNGTTYLGSGTTYYLGNGAAASKLYSLTVGSSSSTQLSVTNGGVVTVAASTALTTSAATYASATGALKVAGSVAIGGQLQLYGGRVYFGGTGHYLEYDSTNNAIHTDIGFYSDSFVTGGGIGSSGGSGSEVNVNTYAQIQAGTATGVASENSAYVPTSYALRQVYNSLVTLSSNLANYLSGNSPLTSLLLRNTNNSPTITFQGAYDGTLGANVTLGTLAGYRETISSTVYTGLSVGADLFIPNGKHLYTYNYNGAPRSIAYYATSNYNYLQLGDTAGVTNIKGSTVQINDNAIGTAAYKGTATSISSSSTDSSLATAKAVYTYVSTNCVTSSVLEDYVLSSSLGAAATKGVATSLSSTSTNLITSKAVYDGCKHRFFKEYASTDFDNGSTTVDTWWRVGSIGTSYSSLDFVFTNNYNSDECASVYFNISQGYSVNGAKIGQPNYVITQTGGYNKFIKAIRIVYYNANRGSSYPTAHIELLLSAGSTNKLWCECSTTHQTFTWRDTPILGFIGSSSASSSYRATTLYTSRGPSTSGGYDCGWLFDLAANASIGQTSASQFLIPQLLNAISTGTPVLYRTESVTINSVTYTTRFDVHVARRGSAGIMLYYFNSPNSGSVEMNCIEIGYSSGWKVTAKYTKTL